MDHPIDLTAARAAERTRESLDATNRWFVRHGMPHAIPGYSAREDVWTRAWPFLLFVLFIELFTSFGDRFERWAQAGVFVAGLGVLVGAFAAVNLVRGRRPTQLPDDIGVPELAVFVLVPAALPILFGEGGFPAALGVLAANLAVLGVAFVVTSYGLVPALKVGLLQAVRQVRTVVHLVARGLPLLLLITTFVFLNAEMWQVAHDFTPRYFAICVVAIVALAMAFLALRLPSEVGVLARFDSWDTAIAVARRTDAPIVDALPQLDGTPPDPELRRVEVVNIGLLLSISQVVQTVLIGLVAGAFFVAFGLLAVREPTILQWTTADRLDPIVRFGLFGDQVVLTWELLTVAGFVAAFSVLQFSVASVTDATYRDQFYDDVAADVREVMAVRAIVREISGVRAAATPTGH